MTRIAYSRRAPAVWARVGTPGIVGAAFVAFAQLACTAGVKPSQAGAAGTTGAAAAGGSGLGGTGTAGTGSSGTTGSGGTTGTAATGGTTPTDAGACQQAEVMFVPKIPTVYLLVDRSGSMFHCLTGNTGDAVCSDMTNTSWANLKTAIESVMTQLDGQVRFGFSTIYGTNPVGGGSCPSLQGMLTNNVSPALNNAGAIKTVYDGLAFPPNSTQMGIKFESPASESIASVAKALTSDTTPGDKFIIFLTDGQPDYCDDSNSLCAPDSVIYQLQKAYTAGIKTIVLGVQTALFDLAPGVLQAFANAGAGEPTLPPVRTGGTTFDFYDQCASIDGWKADLTASGQTPMRGDTLGVYSTTMGPTMPFTANATDQTMLVSQLSAALAGVKSCTFDLSNVGGKAIKVSLDKLGKASVVIQGTTVPLDANNKNGWDMTSDTVLELFGPACDAWRDPKVTDIQFNFPCDIIIS
jgi:hypothetical protein